MRRGTAGSVCRRHKPANSQAISETTAETTTLEPPTPAPPGGGPPPPASRTPEIERVSLSTPETIPTPTTRPRPTFFPTQGPDINEIQSWDTDKIALAYAHCNGTYTGEERKYRYRTASDTMFLNAYEQHKISSLIAEHCSGNFNTRQTSPQPKSQPRTRQPATHRLLRKVRVPARPAQCRTGKTAR